MSRSPCVLKEGVHVVHADAVDEHVGGGVVADGNHHGREIAQRDPRHARREAVHDVAVLHQIGGINGVEVREVQLALLGLPVEFSEDADLDGARLRVNVIGVQQVFVTVGEIDDGDAHDAVETAVNVQNGFF